MKILCALILCCSISFACQNTFANHSDVEHGLSVSYSHGFGFDNQYPGNPHGFRLAYLLHPKSFTWGPAQLLFDVSYARFYSERGPNRKINIFALAPIFKLYIYRKSFISPYLLISVGPSINSNRSFGGTDLGLLFAFQDRLGLGLSLGRKKQWFFETQFLHYSNASLSKHNPGITAPITFTLGYMFQ